MKQKEKLLLRYLIDHKKEYVTSQRLASELLLSDRTIRNYLQRIKELVEKNGGKIIAKPGYGYQLHILQRLTFDLFLSRQEIVPGYARDMDRRGRKKSTAFYHGYFFWKPLWKFIERIFRAKPFFPRHQF